MPVMVIHLLKMVDIYNRQPVVQRRIGRIAALAGLAVAVLVFLTPFALAWRLGAQAPDVTSVVANTPLGVKPGGALYLVPASIKAADIAKVLRQGYDVELLNEGFRTLVKDLKLDILVIDTHPGLNEETLLSITISDVLLLILRPDRQDFQGTAVTVDVARRLDVPNLYLVLNKVPSGVDLADLRAQMDGAYGAETVAMLPLSEEVVQNASGDLFSLTNPDLPWSAEIRKIADSVRA